MNILLYFFTTALFTCVISASCLFHSDRPDGVLLPLLPSDPVLLQRGCGEEASPLDHRTTGHLSSQVTPRSRLSTPKRAAQNCPWCHVYCLNMVDRTWPGGVFTWEESNAGWERVRERRARVRHDRAITTRTCWLMKGDTVFKIEQALPFLLLSVPIVADTNQSHSSKLWLLSVEAYVPQHCCNVSSVTKWQPNVNHR